MPNAGADAPWSVGSQLSSIKADGDNVYILWQNNGPDKNIYFRKSTDHGNSFDNAIRISDLGDDPDSGSGFASDALMAVPVETENGSSDTGAKHVYVAWLNKDPDALHTNVLFRSSSDGGNTFAEPTSLTDSGFKGDSGIQQLFASGNNVYALLINEWADQNNVDDYYYDLVLKVSQDNGKTLGNSIHLLPNLPTRNIRAGLSINIAPLLGSNSTDDNNPHPSNQNNDALYLAWTDYGSCTVQQVTCKDIKIFFRKSVDSGKTFSNPVEIMRPKAVLDYDKTLSSPEPTHLQLAGSSDGKDIYVLWAEYIIKQDSQRIFLAKSNDGGLTFSNPVDLSKNGISEFPRIIVSSYSEDGGATTNLTNRNGNSNVYVAWKYDGSDISSQAGDIPGIMLVKSSDGGNTFSQPVNISPKMHRPFWDIVVSQSENHVYSAWEERTENPSGLPEGTDIYFRASDDAGETFGNILHLTDDNVLKTLLATQKKALSSVAPQVAISPDGKYAYVAWQASYPDSTEIYVKASVDAGKSFGRIISLNDQAKDPVSKSIAVGSSGPFFGQILTPMGLTVVGSGVTIVGIVALIIFRRRKNQ